ncbi:MAG: hypothetical protein FGM44_07475 [Limnohabitans sp.]|nr:hypothetical protein [Limnohabitans sp.]
MAAGNRWQCLVAAQDFPWMASSCAGMDVQWWRSMDGHTFRGYRPAADTAAVFPWIALTPLISFEGASHGEVAQYHYVVETDVPDAALADFNAWYETEHMPGLARVPGTIRASRYVRTVGSPRFVACYDLVTPAAMEREEWLAVRHTDWSSRVRPQFRNTFRTLYQRHDVTAA